MAELVQCEICGKEPATVFLSEKESGAGNRRSLCLNCAKQQDIPQVQEYLRQKKAPAAGQQMCVQCGELPALVYVSRSSDGETRREGFCVFCARAQKIPQIEEALAGLELSDDELRRLHEDLRAQKPDGLFRKISQFFKS